MKRIDKQAFFWENPQMLGFSNPARATVVTVKEVVDNALDACDDARVLPDIVISLTSDGDLFSLSAKDNGIGIHPDYVGNAFGELLFGSKFDVYRQSRGQQGIGISAAFLWSQKTTGEPIRVVTKMKDNDAWEFILTTVGRGTLNIKSKRKIDVAFSHGTIVEMKFKGSWQSKRHLVTYLEGVSLANPHANILARLNDEEIVFRRRSNSIPHIPVEVGRHPHAIDIGIIEEMSMKKNYKKLSTLLMDNFALGRASINKIEQKCPFINNPPSQITKQELKQLVDTIKSMKFPMPPSTCLSPLGEEIVRETLQRYNPQIVSAVKRRMSIYNGHPFVVECGIAYGGDIDEFKLFRIANRVPLVYDESACAITSAVRSVNWKSYGFKQNKDELPDENVVVLVHFCSTLVPFGNQAKSYIAPDDAIVKEMRLALQQTLRDISTRIARKRRAEREEQMAEKKLKLAVEIVAKLRDVLEIDNSEELPYESIARICGLDNDELFKKRVNDLISRVGG